LDETTIGLVVGAIALGGLFGTAFLLQRRARSRGPIGGPSINQRLPPQGPVGRVLFVASRLLIGGMILAILGTFLFRTITLAWVAAALLLLGLVIGFARQFVDVLGK